MLTWVHWIVSIVSWRKHHMDIADPDVLVLEINDEVVKGPRDKSNGFLASGRGSALTGDRSTVRLSVALKVICPRIFVSVLVSAH